MPPPTSGARRVHDRTGHRHRPFGPGATLGEHLAAANSGSPVELTADLIADPRDALSEDTAQKAAFEARLQATSGHGPPSVQDEADAAHLLVQDAVDATEPAVVFHGHWHHQNRCRLPKGSEVVGLAADGNPPSAAVLSVGDLQADQIDPLQRSHHH